MAGKIQPIVALSLAAGLNRSSDSIQEITISLGKDLVKLDPKMELLEYPQYRATLKREGGDEIRTQIETSIKGQFPGLYISTELLPRGDYVLSLSGITDTGEEEIDDYYFRVNRK